MVGCAAIIGFAFFAIIGIPVCVIGLLSAIFSRAAPIGEWLLMASMLGAMAFVASLILFCVDQGRSAAAHTRAQRSLSERSDRSEDDFCSQFPGDDPNLVSQVRAAIAEFFDVPPNKIDPSCNLSVLELNSLAPGFQSFVVNRVSQMRDQPPKWPVGADVISLPPSGTAVTVADFTREVIELFQ